MIRGYCVRCSRERNMTNTKPYKMRNGRKAIKGNCMVCHTKMNVITG